MDKLLNKVAKLKQESSELRAKASLLDDESEDILEDNFGIREGMVVTPELLIKTIMRISKNG